MQTDKQPQEGAWEENILNALYYAFAASDAEGRVFFLNLLLESIYKRPSFLTKLYEAVASIRSEGIFEVSEETWAWVEFWKQFKLSDKEKIPAQIERLQSLRTEEALSRESQGILHFLLAFMEAERGEHQAAAQLYEQSAQFLPNFSWTYNNWGNSLAALRQHEQAIKKYQKAIEFDSKHAGAYYNWGNRLGDLGRHEEAIAKYQKAIELDPKFAYAYNSWGISLGDLGQHEEAIAKYQKAIELDPKYASAYNSWGYHALLIGRLEEAVAQLKKAMELDASDYSAPINLGIAYYRLQQLEDGKKYFALGLENCREHSAACQLNKATALLGLERTEEAKAQLQETVVAFKLTPGEQKYSMTDWQLLAAAPTPPAGIEEFMALARKLFGQA